MSSGRLHENPLLQQKTLMTSAKEIIDTLKMKPHPEGGYYVQTFRDTKQKGGRPQSTAIYYLLEAGGFSAWHRVVDAVEIWHYYAGSPLALEMSQNEKDITSYTLGPNIVAGENPQIVVPANWWQTAKSLGHWTLVGSTVSPGFDFSSFQMAPQGWRPTAKRK